MPDPSSARPSAQIIATAAMLAAVATLSGAGTAAAVSSLPAPTVYGLTSGGGNLVTFSADNPGGAHVVTASGLIGGVRGGEVPVSLHFRAGGNTLYVLTRNPAGLGHFYLVDGHTGQGVPVPGAVVPHLRGTAFSMAFDQAGDLRILSEVGQNLHLTGPTLSGFASTADTRMVSGQPEEAAPAYASNDAHAGAAANLAGISFVSSGGAPSATSMLALEYRQDTLVNTDTPSAGHLSTRGPLSLDVTNLSGLDSTPDGRAFVTADPMVDGAVGDGTNLYSLNIATGALGFVGAVATDILGQIAVDPAPTPSAPCAALSTQPPTAPDAGITAAPKTQAWEAQYAAGVRQQFGLDASATAIAAAAADPLATSDSLGTPLTQPEQLAFSSSRASALGTTALQDRASALIPDSFAGTWFDYDLGGHFMLAVTTASCPSAAVVAQLQATVKAPVTFVLASGSATYSRLVDLNERLNDDNPTLEQLGVLTNDISLDVQNNYVNVVLDPSSAPTAVATLMARYGATGLHFGAPTGPAAPADWHTNPPASPVYGGEDIVRADGGSRCTSNVSAYVTHDSSTEPYAWHVMTAGHCFGVGTHSSQNNKDYDPNEDSLGSTPNGASLFVYSSAKDLGTPDYTPVKNGATVVCDCEAIGAIPGERTTARTLVDGNRVFEFANYTDKAFLNSRPNACENGATEYAEFGHVICGRVNLASTSTRLSGTRADLQGS